MQFCRNCQKQLSSDKFDLHLGYCRRNIVKCQQCKKPYDKNYFEEHQQQFHLKKECEYCHLSFASAQFSRHSQLCNFKPIFCQFCQQTIPRQILTEHKQKCSTRTQPCRICKIPIIKKKLAQHQDECVGIPEQRSSSQSSGSYYSQLNYPGVQRVRIPAQSYTDNVYRHQIRNLGERDIPNRQPQIQSYSYSSSYSYSQSSESPSHNHSYSTYQPTSPTHYTQSYQNGQFSENKSINSSNYDFGQEDAELQAALMASLGSQAFKK